MENKISEENRSMFRRIRKWIIVQKYTLNRGYGNVNIFMMGVVCAASIKSIIPGIINTFWRFLGLVILGFIGLYVVGWFDKKFKFLHVENAYQTETNPILMELVNANREVKNEKEKN